MVDTVTRSNGSDLSGLDDGMGVCVGAVQSSVPRSSGTADTHSTVRFSVTPSFPRDVLAVGGELKNTVCFGHEEHAWVTGIHGVLTDPSNYRTFAESIATLRRRHRCDSYVIAHDLHPSYMSTSFARSLGQPTVAVQHHHAHGVSCALDDADRLLPARRTARRYRRVDHT